MKKRVFRWTKGLVLCLLLVLVLSMGSVASADYYITNANLGKQPVSKTFTVVRTISDINGLEGEMSDPKDIFIDQNDYLYILDTNNGRVVVLDEKDQLVRVVGGADKLYGKDNVAMNKPQGLYVDEIGDLYICDTENMRILHLTAQGDFVEEFGCPTEATYDTATAFKPTKIALDSFGRMYVSLYRDYHGILLIDGNNQFLGYIASTKVVTTWFDKLQRTFYNKAQREKLARETPAYFSNFTVKDNFIYGTTHWSDTDQLRKLTPAGGNVLQTGVYGEKNDSDQFNNKAGFNDIAVDSRGLLYAGDFVTGKIYVYHQEGQNLAVFGGIGRITGCFQNISSMAINSKDQLYVLDGDLNTVQVFEPTKLMSYVMEATVLFEAGRYDEAAVPWGKVLEMDSSNYLANIGLAKADYREGKYESAMEMYKYSFDTVGYSAAFEKYRLQYYREYFLLVVLIGLVALVALYFVISRLKRKADVMAREPLCTTEKLGWRGYGRITLLMIFHPIDCCYGMKRNRQKLSIWPPLILLLLVSAVRIAYIYAVHFPLSDLAAVYSDLWQQIGILLLPLVSWIIVGYALISIASGKQTLKEMFTATMFSFLPYILLMLPLAGLSHFMCGSEAGLFNLLTIGVWAWSLCLVFVTTKVMNEYSFGKMVGMILLIAFGMLCAWMILALFYIVIYQAWNFLYDVYEELILVLD